MNPLQQAHEEIGKLQAEVMFLEARLSALAAIASALLETHPRRDEVMTRAGRNLAPILQMVGSLGDDHVKFSAEMMVIVEDPQRKLTE